MGGGSASITGLQCHRRAMFGGFLPPGPKGNNGVMGKILRAVTSFGFRMYSTGLLEALYGVCLCMCVSVLPADMLKRDELSEFVAIHHLFL